MLAPSANYHCIDNCVPLKIESAAKVPLWYIAMYQQTGLIPFKLLKRHEKNNGSSTGFGARIGEQIGLNANDTAPVGREVSITSVDHRTWSIEVLVCTELIDHLHMCLLVDSMQWMYHGLVLKNGGAGSYVGERTVYSDEWTVVRNHLLLFRNMNNFVHPPRGHLYSTSRYFWTFFRNAGMYTPYNYVRFDKDPPP